jgi:ABC-type oligopeptide transport system substrate-binding subunit
VRTLALRLALLFALALGACAPAAPPGTRAEAARWFGSLTPPRGNVLRFNNGADPETYDPGMASGQPDGRIARILFEGLAVPDPRTLEPLPGQAYRWEKSADGLTYTFHLRPGLVWSDGTPLGARDFVWSWLRVLAPANAARYATALYPIAGAEAFNRGTLRESDRVGIHAPDDSTLVVRLHDPTPYFVFLTMFYTYMPVPRHVVERWGAQWTRPGRLVGNGPFTLELWRQQDRFEFARNPRYWDAASVRLERVIAYSVDDLNTTVNLYKAGVIDWTTSGSIPAPFVPHMMQFADYQHARFQAVYFYGINCRRPPFDNVWLRRALNLAVDRDAIAHDLLKGTREAWGNFTPMGYPGYRPPPGVRFDPERARACLARAGYPGGKGCPKISILFNTSEDHRRIAEAIQQMWTRELHVPVELSNQEWGSYLQATTSFQYDIARRSWIGDYLDPNTFLAVMVTDDGNNRTGWSDARYDALIHRAAAELDSARRLATLAQAESLLLDQSPVIPIYLYTVNDLVKPYVRGIYPNALDTHPLRDVWIDHDWKPAPSRTAAR